LWRQRSPLYKSISLFTASISSRPRERSRFRSFSAASELRAASWPLADASVDLSERSEKFPTLLQSCLLARPFSFFFFTPFVLQSRYQWFYEAFLNLSCFSIQVCYARCCCCCCCYSGWFMELAFASQEKTLPLVSQEDCCVAFLSLQSFNI